MDYFVSYANILSKLEEGCIGQLRLLPTQGGCHFLFVIPQEEGDRQQVVRRGQNVCAWRVCYKGEILQIHIRIPCDKTEEQQVEEVCHIKEGTTGPFLQELYAHFVGPFVLVLGQPS